MELISERIYKIRKTKLCYGCETNFKKGSLLKKIVEKDGNSVNSYFICQTCDHIRQDLDDMKRWWRGDLKDKWDYPFEAYGFSESDYCNQPHIKTTVRQLKDRAYKQWLKEEEEEVRRLEKQYGGKSPSGRYYIYSPKYTRGEQIRTFWCPNNCGYTYDLDKAGIYTQEEIDKGGSYYRNTNHIAVPVESVENGKLGTVMRTVRN